MPGNGSSVSSCRVDALRDGRGRPRGGGGAEPRAGQTRTPPRGRRRRETRHRDGPGDIVAGLINGRIGRRPRSGA